MIYFDHAATAPLHPKAKEAMAEAMEKLYLDEALRNTMSRRARFMAAEFDVSNTIAGYSALYSRCAEKK